MDTNKNVLEDHTYDNIRVLNNKIPTWSLNIFYLTIMFSFVYLSYFHVLDIGDLSRDEYMREMDPNWRPTRVSGGIFSEYHSPMYDIENSVTPFVREKLKNYIGSNAEANDLIMYAMSRSDAETLKKLRATFPGLYDKLITGGLIKIQAPVESISIVALMDEASLAAGKQIFLKNCASCHAPDGGGIVGPNLTDDHWIHGAGIENVVKIINFGNPSKGMIPWRGTLKNEDIVKVSSFILTMHGTTPQVAKAPEGEKVKYPLEDKKAVEEVESAEESEEGVIENEDVDEGVVKEE